MAEKIERQILWNKYPIVDGGVCWNFLVINTRPQIKRIKGKLQNRLAPLLEEPHTINEDYILNSDLTYSLFSLKTYYARYLSFSGIYEGKVKFDRRLERRTRGLQGDLGWNTLIEKVHHGEI